MEVFSEEKIEIIDKQLAELKKALNRFDDEKERPLTIKPSVTEKSTKPKINYSLKEKKYDYERICKLEKLDEPQKMTTVPKIDKNWLAANMEPSDIMDFYDEKEMYQPSQNFEKDFKDQKVILNSHFASLMQEITKNDGLTVLNSKSFKYTD